MQQMPPLLNFDPFYHKTPMAEDMQINHKKGQDSFGHVKSKPITKTQN
jgi:hypothetical protein